MATLMAVVWVAGVLSGGGPLGKEVPAGCSPTTCSPSVSTLLATPERFDGVTVSVIGVLRYEFESNALYASDWHYAMVDPGGGVPIDSFGPGVSHDFLKSMNGRVVILLSKFKVSPPDASGFRRISFTRAESIQLWVFAPSARYPKARFPD